MLPKSIDREPMVSPRAGLKQLVATRVTSEYLVLGLLLVFALSLRVLWLDRIPTNITADEADNLTVIFRIYETGKPDFFGLDWKPQPAFSMYLFIAFMQVFGDTIFGLRVASAVLSTAALVPFYFLARRVAEPAAALLATLMLATSIWYLNFSRSGWENAHAALYALLATWFITIALERRKLGWFVAAGGAAALGLYGYFAGRLILPALLAYAPLAVWWQRGRRLLVVGGFCLILVTTLGLYLPQNQTIQSQEEFRRRIDAINVLSHPRPYLGETTDVGILRIQSERMLRGFFLLDGELFNNGRYSPPGRPIFDPATGVLVVVGLLLSVRHLRATALWWAMLFVPLIGTQVFSAHTPDAARAVMVAPFAYLFVALSLGKLMQTAKRGSFRVVAPIAIVAVLVVAGLNVGGYFQWIQSPATAQSRQPAVELDEYDRWQSALREHIRAHGAGFNVGEWHEMRRRN